MPVWPSGVDTFHTPGPDRYANGDSVSGPSDPNFDLINVLGQLNAVSAALEANLLGPIWVNAADPQYAGGMAPARTDVQNGAAFAAAAADAIAKKARLWVPPGCTTTPWNLDNVQGLIVESNGTEGGGTAGLVTFTNGDANPMVSARSSSGLKLRNLNFLNNNAAFTGVGVDYDHHDPAHPVDAAYMTISECSFRMPRYARGAIRLNNAIIGSVRDVSIFGGQFGVIGRDPGYSNVMVFSRVTFYQQYVNAVLNPGQSWSFDAPTFEPLMVTNEVQTVTTTGSPAGGTFTLSFGGQTTAPVAAGATAGAVQAALQALSSVGTGNCMVRRLGRTGTGSAFEVIFTGTLGGAPQALLTADGSGLTGGTSPGVTVTEKTAGSASSHATAGITTDGNSPSYGMSARAIWVGDGSAVGAAVTYYGFGLDLGGYVATGSVCLRLIDGTQGVSVRGLRSDSPPAIEATGQYAYGTSVEGCDIGGTITSKQNMLAFAFWGNHNLTNEVDSFNNTLFDGNVSIKSGTNLDSLARAGQLTDSSGGTSGGGTVAAVVGSDPSVANAIATLAARLNALENIVHATHVSA